ncbi:unnamed protein product [Didymodactylos carnosus]|uniref:Uncharacterized protein n=1 Tax=Didymodactylos carnosus TaxID=1234261 RepID=A0A814JUP0_9BILA|nr:unnamed protein product [Didymodactylos carnosus]CAF3812373.1 unnamed protein product [Didymodactylos carnosus]
MLTPVVPYRSFGQFTEETSLILIYVDTNTSPNLRLYENLQLLNDRTLIFYVHEPFLEYIRTHCNQHANLILSTALVDELVRQVHHLPNVDSVYIHHHEADRYNLLSQSCSKVRAVYRNPDNLFSQIGIDLGLLFFKRFEQYKKNGDISAANECHQHSLEMYNIVNECMKADEEEIKEFSRL